MFRERFEAAELLFNPFVDGVESVGTSELVFNSINVYINIDLMNYFIIFIFILKFVRTLQLMLERCCTEIFLFREEPPCFQAIRLVLKMILEKFIRKKY